VDRAILLVDTDLGFLFWLGRALDQAGYEAFPARTIPDAMTLLVELHLTVGLLILNCSLPGAEDFVARMRHSRKNLKVISLVGQEPLLLTPGVDAICPKPSEINDRSKVAMLRIVHQVLPNTLAS